MGTSFLVTLQYFLELISPISKSKLNKFYLDVILGWQKKSFIPLTLCFCLVYCVT